MDDRDVLPVFVKRPLYRLYIQSRRLDLRQMFHAHNWCAHGRRNSSPMIVLSSPIPLGEDSTMHRILKNFRTTMLYSILNHKFAEGDPAHIKDKLFAGPEDKNDRLSLEHSLEHAKDTEHDVGAEHQDAKMLAFISANIDEWTSSDTTHQSQTLLELSHKDVERPHNPPEAHPSFQNIYPSLPNADSVRLLRLHGTRK
ncbi:hypothetical protein BKA58DRAFT_137431 [Alternaria rosae]|uniref:uncharacterized protein n=1 Tax=Alternaria rosae TaxID=1187941 RepID=UPI001E8D8B11|nr:uncharacterized protein BKA58DRAFT_137431 [Alternaria rosae]KAH6876205.1 hypothetical protein BKA58DRAFT_137431 [Alternaria rosae]